MSTGEAPFTQRTAEVMAFILAHFEEFDRLPSIRDMRTHFTWTSNTIAVRHLKRLDSLGYLEKSGAHYRFSRSWPGRPVMAHPPITARH